MGIWEKRLAYVCKKEPSMQLLMWHAVNFKKKQGYCHGSMIHEVLFQAGNHSISCGISGRNQGFPLHHFSQGFPHFENEVPAYSIVYLQ